MLAIFALIGLIRFGLNKDFTSGYFISGAILTPFTLATWFFVSHKILTHILDGWKKRRREPHVINLQTRQNAKISDDKKRSQANNRTEIPTDLEDGVRPFDEGSNVIEMPSKNDTPPQAASVSSQTILDLPDEMIMKIFELLQVEDLRVMTQVSRNAHVHMDQVQLERAREYGYKGESVTEAKEYLKDLFELISILGNKQSIPEQYIVRAINIFGYTRFVSEDIDYPISVPVIDSEETFRKLRAAPPEVLQFILDRTVLDIAVIGRDLKTARLLLQIGADVNNKAGYGGYTPLIHAAYEGRFEMATFLLEHGARVNDLDARGCTALYWAIRGGIKHWIPQREIGKLIQLLLQSGANPNIPGFNGSPPLHFAAQHGYSEIVTLLLKHSAQINAGGENGVTALCFALMSGVNPKPESQIKETVQILLDAGADLTISANNGNLPLHYAAESGYFEMLALLLERGARAQVNSLGAEGKPVLCMAFGTEEVWNSEDEIKEMVGLLLKAGANLAIPANDGNLPLHFAARYGSSELVAFLLEHGARDNINQRNNEGSTALYFAISSGRGYRDEIKEIVKLLLIAGASPHIPANNGNQPIHEAALYRYSQTVSLLIAYEAGVDHPGAEGMTALCSALRRGGRFSEARIKEVILVLLEGKANPNVPAGNGSTPIHFAAQFGYSEIVALLIDRGARVNTRGAGGNTALCFALESEVVSNEDEMMKMVKLLLDKGADPRTARDDGTLPMQIAARRKFPRIVALLFWSIVLNRL
jgi:ankyrin repeat protein